jgi:antirestriction protein ArdC
MTTVEQQAEALDRARNGQTWTNYPAIFAGFIEKGIAESEIKPRENVFTFQAWKALGRSVKKGEHGVKVVTFIDCSGRVEIDRATGEEKQTSYRRPHTTTVFHISQTEPTAERDACTQSSGRTYRGWRREGNRQVPDHRDYVRDRGEDAADRWNETHY